MSKNFWKNLEKPIKVLSPMAGYTDAAFRLLCRELGADVVVSELVSADAIAYSKLKVERAKIEIEGKNYTFNKVSANKNNTTAELLSFFEEERPFVVQLFGKYPEKFGLAAKWITETLKPDGIDINMGCPARKVVGSDHGAALLKKPELAVEIVKAVKKNTNLPVSVKTRLGWDSDDDILEFAPKLVGAGIDAIIIHGRTYKDGFKGTARWENVYKVKNMFGGKLVVIGNGDFNSSKLTDDLDGYAIGRASFGKPWIFNLEQKELKGIILKHAELVSATKGSHGLVEFRKHLLAYLRGFSEAKKLRLEAIKVEQLSDVQKILSML